jgi:DNA repair ATPase RecN
LIAFQVRMKFFVIFCVVIALILAKPVIFQRNELTEVEPLNDVLQEEVIITPRSIFGNRFSHSPKNGNLLSKSAENYEYHLKKIYDKIDQIQWISDSRNNNEDLKKCESNYNKLYYVKAENKKLLRQLNECEDKLAEYEQQIASSTKKFKKIGKLVKEVLQDELEVAQSHVINEVEIFQN